MTAGGGQRPWCPPKDAPCRRKVFAGRTRRSLGPGTARPGSILVLVSDFFLTKFCYLLT